MSEINRVTRLLEHAYDGRPWYGTPLHKLLADIEAERAAAHPVVGAHGIWEEVLHVIAWRKVAARLIRGEPADDLSDAENWPAPPKASASAWQQTLDDLARTQQDLISGLSRLTDDRLHDKAPGKPYSLYVLLHGVIQHDVYHAGQIALLKNAAG